MSGTNLRVPGRTRKSLDEIQEDFFLEVGHKPHSVRQLLAFCQQKSTGHKFKDINSWWPTRPEPEEKPQQEPINPYVSRDFTLGLQSGNVMLESVNEQEEEDDLPTPRIGALQSETPGRGQSKAPRWSTMESMQMDFVLDDLSDDDDLELDESASYDTHASWGLDGDDREDEDGDSENDGGNPDAITPADNPDPGDTAIEVIGTNEMNQINGDTKSNHSQSASDPDDQKDDIIDDADDFISPQIQALLAKPSKITHSQTETTLSVKPSKPSLKLRPSPKMRRSGRRSGAMTVSMIDTRTSRDMDDPFDEEEELPGHLSIELDFVAAPPTLRSTASVPIRKMTYFKVDPLTIQLNGPDFWEKRRQQNLRRKSRRLKNMRFKDMQSLSPSSPDPYLDDMKSQFANYGHEAHQSGDSIVLSEDERIRQELINEIVDTEKSYVGGLQTLMNEFVKPVFDKKLIKLKHKDTVTSNIPDILSFHESFLEALIDATKSEVDITVISEDTEDDETDENVDRSSLCSVFQRLCNDNFVEMYTRFCKDYHKILEIFAKYGKSRKLTNYLKQKRAERKPLTNHLILPIQRVTRYLLLLQELKKRTHREHADYQELEDVLSKINETVNAINERQREIENLSQCLQVQETVSGLKRNIVESHRKLMAQYVFRKKENQRGRQFFVFNDLLIITNLKLKAKAVIEMKTIEVKRLPHTGDLEFHLFSLKHNAVYQTDPDKQQELEHLLLLIERHRNLAHVRSLRDVGADDLAHSLKRKSISVSHGDLYREEVQRSKRGGLSITSLEYSCTDTMNPQFSREVSLPSDDEGDD